MNVCEKIQDANIVKFINMKNSRLVFTNFRELIKEGNVREFFFVYKKKSGKELYKSKPIYKLDLYERKITTADGKTYKIMNEVDFSKK